MSGYFSRLIQQTGIAVVKDQFASMGSVISKEVSPLKSYELLKIRSKHFSALESDESLTTNEDRVNDEREMKNVESNYSSVTIAPTLNFLDPNAMQFVGEAIASNRDRSDLPETILAREVDRLNLSTRKQQPEIVERNREIISENNSELPDNVASSNFANIPKRLGLEKNFENSIPVVREIPGSPIISAKELPEVRAEVQLLESRDRQSTATPPESHSLPTHQVNLQTVREWVSKTPEANLSAQLETPNRPSHITNYPSPITHHQLPITHDQLPINQPEKTPNFKLAIGTISLTVEAPKPEIKQPQTLPKQTNRTAEPVPQTSRMNRHYIRLR